MRRALLSYDLPEGAIATRPAEPRESARMLVLPPGDAPALHARVADLPACVPEGALVVVNDTRVIPARLLGHKVASGGKVELLLVRRRSSSADGSRERWAALGRASKGLRAGAELRFDGPLGRPSLLATLQDPRPSEGGARPLVEVELAATEGTVAAALDAVGHVPLPPYLGRADDAADRAHYQTAFAREPGAVAAPTAGLHLTPALLEALERRGARLAAVTLHVGLGTFSPVTADDFDDHPMHSEIFEVPEATARAVRAARLEKKPVVAIGTTVVRALESAASADEPGHVLAAAGETSLLIQPGYRFRVVDALFTNFHLPESTLLALVCAFGGQARVLGAYGDAIAAGYRFFSYGDAMWLASRAASGAA